MKYTVIEAAKVVGISRQTIYRHIEKKPITTEKDDDGNIFIDASELIRVYGNNIDFNAHKDSDNPVTSNNDIKKLHAVTKSDGANDIKIIEERLNSAGKQIEMLEIQMRREREILEEQIVTLKDALKVSQDVQNKTVALLENKSNLSNNGNSNDWQKSLKALEDRIANQEVAIQEKIALEAEKTAKEAKEKEELRLQLEEKEKILAEKEEALKIEKSKSFLHKLFGK